MLAVSSAVVESPSPTQPEAGGAAQPGGWWRDALVAAAFTLALTVPFVGKPVQVDDAYFLEVAAGIRDHPTRPYDGAAGLEDADYRVFAARGSCPETFSSMSHPPLLPYVLAAVAALAGGFAEASLHAALLPFAVLAALACLSLARRFTRRPLVATLGLVTGPAFVLSAQSLMTDLPALALSLAGLACFVRGVDARRRRELVLAGLLVGLALVTRYSAALMLVVLLAYAGARGRVRLALPALLGAALVFGAWCCQNLVAHGQLHLVASSRHYAAFYAGQSFDLPGLVGKAWSALAGLGGTAFAPALLALGLCRGRLAPFAGAGLAWAASLFVLLPTGFERLETYGIAAVLGVAACTALGAVLAAAALARPAATGGDADLLFLRAWFGLSLLGAVACLPFGAVRYLLPALPPLLLLLTRGLDGLGLPPARAWRVAALAVGQGLALSVALALADQDLAERYRAVALAARASSPNGSVWYVGEWGFRYYMERAGARYLRSDDERPTTGDVIVRPEIAGLHDLAPGVRARATPIQRLELLGRWPIRLLSFDAKAGFYSNHWGYLPWAISRAPLERIEVFEVKERAPAPVAAACASS